MGLKSAALTRGLERAASSSRWRWLPVRRGRGGRFGSFDMDPRMETLRASVEQERDAARAEIRAAEAEQSDGS